LTEDKHLKPTDGGITVLDDTIDDIKGKKVEGVSTVKDSNKKTRTGHQLVTAHYKDDKKDYPLIYRLYQQKKVLEKFDIGDEFRTKIQLAIEILVILISAGLISSTVVFDSWYCSKQLIAFLEWHDLFFVSRLKSNRNVLWENNWIPVSDLFLLIPSSDFQKTKFYTKRKHIERPKKRKYWTYKIRLEVKDLGIMTLILSKKRQTGNSGYILITNNEDLTSKDVCIIYSHRWSIEAFYRDVKQELHLGSVIFTRWTSYHRHYYFVFWTYLLLMHLSCYGIIKRQLSIYSRSTAKLKIAFRNLVQESVVFSFVRRAADDKTAKTVQRLMKNKLSWSYVQTAI